MSDYHTEKHEANMIAYADDLKSGIMEMADQLRQAEARVEELEATVAVMKQDHRDAQKLLRQDCVEKWKLQAIVEELRRDKTNSDAYVEELKAELAITRQERDDYQKQASELKLKNLVMDPPF